VADEDPSAMKHALDLVGENLLVGVNAGMNAVVAHEGVVIDGAVRIHRRTLPRNHVIAYLAQKESRDTDLLKPT
jgi:hypothetical protein